MRKALRLLAVFLALLFFLPMTMFGQQRTVSGTILSDDDGTPMIGVTVSNLASNKKTQTNSAGYFTIEAEAGQKLTFSFVGYVTKTEVVGEAKLINIRMVANSNDMANIVVTG